MLRIIARSTLVLLLCAAPTRTLGQVPNNIPTAASTMERRRDATPANVLSRDQWRRVDAAVDRALQWLAARQDADGSFPTIEYGQPGVTCLCILAFLAHGHAPGESIYGERIEKAIDYALACQKENGLITLVGPDGPRISRRVDQEIGSGASYNHAISSLTLAELYGTTKTVHARRIESAITKSLAATLEMQRWPKDREQDRGGWRYIDDRDPNDSDLSATGWELKFLRSARNAGFNVPKEPIDDAVAYVRRCYSKKYGSFMYANDGADCRSRAMNGAGILALAHAGFHNSPEALLAGDFILAHDFQRYNVFLRFHKEFVHDQYHYGLFMCCQGMYQLGGRYWEAFFPPVVETLLANQRPDGSWPAENHHYDARFGNAYTTSLVLLTLGAPNQLLPIYQR
jgi:hypothetical protein